MIEAGKRYNILVNREGTHYNVNANVLKVEPNVRNELTVWLELPYSLARFLSNTRIIKVSET
jgi:hypothetical protein